MLQKLRYSYYRLIHVPKILVYVPYYPINISNYSLLGSLPISAIQSQGQKIVKLENFYHLNQAAKKFTAIISLDKSKDNIMILIAKKSEVWYAYT